MTKKAPVVLLRFNDGTTLSDENFADFAQAKMRKGMVGSGQNKGEFSNLTTTKLRGIYGQIMNVSARIATPDDFDAHKGDIQYLKVKLAYEAGRERVVKTFFDRTHMMEALNNVKDYDAFMLYCRYAESLYAYFKFYGGKDK